MARIKVTGYMNVDEINPDFVDLDHATGLTDEGYGALTGMTTRQFDYSLSGLEDLETEVVED